MFTLQQEKKNEAEKIFCLLESSHIIRLLLKSFSWKFNIEVGLCEEQMQERKKSPRKLEDKRKLIKSSLMFFSGLFPLFILRLKNSFEILKYKFILKSYRSLEFFSKEKNASQLSRSTRNVLVPFHGKMPSF